MIKKLKGNISRTEVKRISKVYYSLCQREVVTQLVVKRTNYPTDYIVCLLNELERYPPKLLTLFLKDLILYQVHRRKYGSTRTRRYIE